MAIDTATDQASLALHDGLRVRMEQTWEAPRRHTIELTARLAAAMEALDLGPERLSGVAVATGPGSFTGLRIGMAVAKGLVMAQRVPLVGIPTLDVLASAQGHDRRPLAAVLRAGRGRICVAIYRWRFGGWRAEGEAHLTTWSNLAEEISEPTLLCGEIDPAGADLMAGLGERAVVLPPAWRLRRAGFLAELGWRLLREGRVDDPAALTPIYLKYPV
ncbi:MAG: tRNA (adenosine(37)-N6)-threonylcarbamoyltransferase complex dimerization subunit type 1 TsaB [Anaerolineae bacterium]